MVEVQGGGTIIVTYERLSTDWPVGNKPVGEKWPKPRLCAQAQLAPAGRMIPHPRTLRKARLQVKLMVDSGFSALKARRYLKQWLLWWTKTVDEWQPADILQALA